MVSRRSTIDHDAAARDLSTTDAPRGANSAVVPRAQLRADALTYQLLKPRDAGPSDLPLLVEAYDCWSATWKEMLSEHGPTTFLPSDDFTRQAEIGAIFHDWACVGMTTFRWLDLSNRIYHDDSYFRRWPKTAIDVACSRGTRVCIGSNLLVGQPWRNATGASVKELLLALAIERFLAADDSDVLVGTMRNNRGMNALGYRLGFECLAQDVVFHGESDKVDLVAFYRKTSKRGLLAAETSSLIRTLYPAARP